jgi:hypothetical protein
VWDLRSHTLRPSGWTSADAAGLPILPGLLRRDEVAAGDVDHAIRLTAARTDKSFLWPARHQAGSASDPSLPPMGAWFRLKAGFDISHFRPDTQVVLRAMQHHGLIVADNGSNWYFTGTSEPGWDTALLDQLKTIPAGAFEAVDTAPLMADPNSGKVASPTPTPMAPPATASTARPTTTTRPKPTTTTTRPATTTTTAPNAGPATTASSAPTPAATAAGADATTTTTVTTTAVTTTAVTTSAGEVAAPTGPAGHEPKSPQRSGRGWLVVPAGLVGLAGTAIAAKRRRRR